MTCAPQVTALSEFEELPNGTEANVPAPGKTCGCKHHIPVLESAAPSCKCKKLRTPRKIHAACGLLLTGFIVLHLGASVTGFNPRIYQQNVDRLHSIVNAIPGVIWLLIKMCGLFFMVAMVKAFVPRYRYDQLMRLGWKVFLPTSIFWVVLTAGWVLVFHQHA